MALTVQQQKAQYPLPAFNFQVTLEGAALRVSEISGLTIEYQTATYNHGLSFSEGQSITKYRYDKFMPISLKRGVVQGLKVLYAWLRDRDLRSLDISLCDEQGAPAVTWHIGKAMATKLQAPTFQASTNEAALETLDLMVSHVSIEHHG